MDTFIEETIFSEKVFDEGDGDAVVTSRQDDEAKEVRKSWLSLETNLKQMKEHNKAERESKSKNELHYANKVMREQGNFSNGVALSEPEKVNTICSLIQNSVASLMRSIQCFNFHPDKPENSATQFSKVQDKNIRLIGLDNERVRVGSEDVCARNGLRNLSSSITGSTNSASESLVNFSREANTKVERELAYAHPGDPIRRGETEGGSSSDSAFNHNNT